MDLRSAVGEREIFGQASAQGPASDARGILLLGFRLHPEGRPWSEASGVLDHVRAPMLFVQAGDDVQAELETLRLRLEPLGPAAVLQVIAAAQQGFQPRAGSGRKPDEILAEVTGGIVRWMDGGLETG